MVKASTSRLLQTLLLCGILAGPFYIFVTVIEMSVRPGFDPMRHSWSLLSNGDLGWIHIANFIITGLLTIAFAVSVKHALRGGLGSTWGPLLLGLYGIGLISAGIFVADPMGGFPVGSPVTNTVTTSGLLHLLSGSVGFTGFIAACFVFARKFKREKERGWFWFSLITGLFFFAAFVGIASGSQPGSPLLIPVTLTFTAAVVLAWTWISLFALKLLKQSLSQ